MVSQDDFKATAYEHLRIFQTDLEKPRPSTSVHETLAIMEELASEFEQLVDITRQSEIILANLAQIRAYLMEMKSHMGRSS